jgi:hypothetical protein
MPSTALAAITPSTAGTFASAADFSFRAPLAARARVARGMVACSKSTRDRAGPAVRRRVRDARRQWSRAHGGGRFVSRHVVFRRIINNSRLISARPKIDPGLPKPDRKSETPGSRRAMKTAGQRARSVGRGTISGYIATRKTRRLKKHDRSSVPRSDPTARQVLCAPGGSAGRVIPRVAACMTSSQSAGPPSGQAAVREAQFPGVPASSSLDPAKTTAALPARTDLAARASAMATVTAWRRGNRGGLAARGGREPSRGPQDGPSVLRGASPRQPGAPPRDRVGG